MDDIPAPDMAQFIRELEDWLALRARFESPVPREMLEPLVDRLHKTIYDYLEGAPETSYWMVQWALFVTMLIMERQFPIPRDP